MFLTGVKEACTGAPDTPMVLLGNFAVEDEWARGEAGLPAVATRASAAVANRMDEFALLLGGEGDHVVLKAAPDPGFLVYLRELGLELPRVLVADVTEPGRSVSEDVLASPELLSALRELGDAGARLWPHGMSAVEERICARTGLAPALPGAAVAKAVNGKIYSRRVADELGIRQVRGWECETVGALAAAAREASAVLAAGGRIGVKDAYGVSGKGIAVVDDPARLDRLVRMVTRRAERSGEERVALVVEQWAAKATDLTCHFTLARDGSVRFDFVKEALIAQGVSVGHRMPARITPAHRATVEEVAHALGKRLAADGYHGVVGVDAMVEQDGGLLPVVEINARNNMATYQTRLQERFVPDGTVALARQYRLRLREPLAFDDLRTWLDGLLFATGPGSGRGLLVDGFATVNAAQHAGAPGEPFTGRLHGLVIAGTQAEAEEWDAAVARRLAALGTEGETA
ncbi:hypothetical protein ABH931_000392 [Streptacidiphilus sp. MAP12-33]|uniref:preATP grasp domain-containing protein n=1 Tax=Streptacidiphilus sp. MAP12-33 TaxID=3156266 RepID=UPI00351564A5